MDFYMNSRILKCWQEIDTKKSKKQKNTNMWVNTMWAKHNTLEGWFWPPGHWFASSLNVSINWENVIIYQALSYAHNT